MRKVMIEFPVVGYAEVTIEVADDYTAEEILDDIRNGDIEILYDGHSHTENLNPLEDLADYANLDIPFKIGVVE